MSLLIVFLTFIMVVNCLFLILLILIQLPKKEAGAGIAFGGAATDALFGAGSGNALTKMTKYAATLFLGLALTLSLLNSSQAHRSEQTLEKLLREKANAQAPVLQPPPSGGSNRPPAATAPNLQAAGALQSSNLPSVVVSTQAVTTANLAPTNLPSGAVANTNAAAPASVQSATNQNPPAPTPAATNSPGAKPQ